MSSITWSWHSAAATVVGITCLTTAAPSRSPLFTAVEERRQVPEIKRTAESSGNTKEEGDEEEDEEEEEEEGRAPNESVNSLESIEVRSSGFVM
jgi:hypothetical protein